MSIILALVIFSAIILFHELGHFLLAKKNGIVVTEFALGMGPKLLKFEKGGTVYALKLLPFGGSCAMLGEDGAEDEEGAFNTKSPLARISVVAAGPIFNFILAFAASMIILSVVGYDPAEVIFVQEGSEAEAAGLQAGDLITSFQGKSVSIARDLVLQLNLDGIDSDEEIRLSYERDGQSYDISYMPTVYTRYLLGFTGTKDGTKIKITNLVSGYPMADSKVHDGDYLVAIDDREFADFEDWNTYMSEHPLDGKTVSVTYERDGLLYEETMTPVESVSTSVDFSYNTGRTKTTLLGVLKYSVIEVKYWIKLTLKSIGMLFTGQVGLKDMSGPVGVVDAIGSTYEEVKSEGFVMIAMNMLNMVILLSANLGVMNLLPIPALDGGRLVFLIIEALRGKPIDREKEGMVHFAGLVVLMILMVVILFQDVQKLL